MGQTSCNFVPEHLRAEMIICSEVPEEDFETSCGAEWKDMFTISILKSGCCDMLL